MDNESLVPTNVSTNTTTIAAPEDYDDQLAQLGLPQHDVRPHLKSFYPTDGTEEEADVFQVSAKLWTTHISHFDSLPPFNETKYFVDDSTGIRMNLSWLVNS